MDNNNYVATEYLSVKYSKDKAIKNVNYSSDWIYEITWLVLLSTSTRRCRQISLFARLHAGWEGRDHL